VVGFLGVLVAAVGVAGARNAPAAPEVSDQRQQEITAAAAQYGVPAPLLVALAGTLSGFGATDPRLDGGHGLFRLADGTPALDGRGGIADTRVAQVRALAGHDPATRALATAAGLAGTSAAGARDVPAEGARAAAALLASYGKQAAGGALPTSLLGWYGAVARFATGDSMTGRAVADDVFAQLRAGLPATVVAGQRFSIAADPAAALPAGPGEAVTGECPAGCRLVPAAGYQPGDRTTVNQVVISTAPAGYSATIAAAQRASARWSAHYVVRAADGAVTQTVLLRDVAWDAGNPTVDAGSVGIAVEANPTPAAYASVARLLRYLAGRGLTLDRQHLLGMDEVAGAPVSLQSGFDWVRVLRAAGAPLTAQAFRADRVVTVAAPGLVLRSAPGGAALADQPAVGRSLAVAGTTDGWTEVWYGGRAAYLSDPAGTRTLPGDADRVTPISAAVPVFGAAESGTPVGTLGTGQAAVLLDPDAVGDYLAIGFGDHIGYVAATDVTLQLD
jgi:hypothetical protein